MQIQQVYARAVRDPYLVIADLNVVPFVQIPGGTAPGGTKSALAITTSSTPGGGDGDGGVAA